ncbi:MAG: hypothetical protein IJ667_03955 [Synergistaceae bacterium]|nr:hypothetical protein [Synergistaceae bacterium]
MYLTEAWGRRTGRLSSGRIIIRSAKGICRRSEFLGETLNEGLEGNSDGNNESESAAD